MYKLLYLVVLFYCTSTHTMEETSDILSESISEKTIYEIRGNINPEPYLRITSEKGNVLEAYLNAVYYIAKDNKKYTVNIKKITTNIERAGEFLHTFLLLHCPSKKDKTFNIYGYQKISYSNTEDGICGSYNNTKTAYFLHFIPYKKKALSPFTNEHFKQLKDIVDLMEKADN